MSGWVVVAIRSFFVQVGRLMVWAFGDPDEDLQPARPADDETEHRT